MARCLEDARYHLKYLSEAVGQGEPALFVHYATWGKTMLRARRIPVEDLVANFEIMLHVLGKELPASMQVPALEYVKAAIRDLTVASDNPSFLDPDQPFAQLANQYLNALLRYERHSASALILRAGENKTSIKDIYCQVFERCQYEIGRLAIERCQHCSGALLHGFDAIHHVAALSLHFSCGSLDDTKRIIGSASGPHRTFYSILAETGIRGGEICALRVADLDLENAVIQVRQNVWRGKIQTVKSRKGNRRFPISAELLEHLRGYLESWRPNSLGLLFATGNGTPWDHSLVRKRKFHPLLKKLGIPQCGFHAFRHGNATLLDQIGAPMAVRLNRLGHAEAQTTMGYTHAVTADERRVANEVGRILHGTARNEQEERPAENALTLMIQ